MKIINMQKVPERNVNKMVSLWSLIFCLSVSFLAGKTRDAKDVFTYIYTRNDVWTSGESRSGVGSELGTTETIRKELPKLLAMLDVQVFLDAPCGDFNW